MHNLLSVKQPLTSKIWPQGQLQFLQKTMLVILGSLIIAVAAQIQVPLFPVPVTLQTLAVVMIAMIGGWQLGLLTVLAYLSEGMLGAPVFAGLASGLPTLLGPVGGYLISFLPAAFVSGYLIEHGFGRYRSTVLLAGVLSFLVIYMLGALGLSFFVGSAQAWQIGVKPFLFGDGLKLIFLMLTVPTFWRR